MRTALFQRAVGGVVCALIVSGCTYEHPGPSLPPESEALASSTSTSAPVSPAPPKPKPAIVSSPSPKPVTVSSTPPKPKVPVKKPQAPVAAKPESDAPAAPASAKKTESGDAGTDAGAGFDNVELVDAGLGGKLGILRVGSEPTANDLLSVFAGLKNKTSHSLNLEIQTIYKDKMGGALNTGSWIPITLKPHEETEYRSASISTDAVDFLVRIRLAPSSKN